MPRRAPSSLVFLSGLVALAIITAAIGGGTLYVETKRASRVQADAITGGDWRRGRMLMARYGCGECHVISGVAGANGKVGPDLTHISERVVLAGRVSNDPSAMRLWIMHPQRISPGNGMPEQGVTKADARDLAAFLYAEN